MFSRPGRAVWSSLACGRRAAAGVEQRVGYQERFPGPAHEKGEPQQIPPADCDGLPEFGQKPRNMGDDSLSMSSGPCPAPTVRITETQQNRGVLQILAQSQKIITLCCSGAMLML